MARLRWARRRARTKCTARKRSYCTWPHAPGRCWRVSPWPHPHTHTSCYMSVLASRTSASRRSRPRIAWCELEASLVRTGPRASCRVAAVQVFLPVTQSYSLDRLQALGGWHYLHLHIDYISWASNLSSFESSECPFKSLQKPVKLCQDNKEPKYRTLNPQA